MRVKMSFFRDREFEDPDVAVARAHIQRCTEAEWRVALLDKQDIFMGGKRHLYGKPLGYGVVELKVAIG